MRLPSFTLACTCLIAWCALRPGLKPKLESENVGSKIGVSTWAMACWTTRSVTVGIPSSRLPPSGLGISTLRTACGVYRPPSICARSAGQCSRAWAGKSSMVTPSMPGAPLLAFTRCHARARLSLASTACSRSSVMTSSCLKARCVPAAARIWPGRAWSVHSRSTSSAPCVSLFSPSAARRLAAYYGVC